jgi:hypothetical protein
MERGVVIKGYQSESEFLMVAGGKEETKKEGSRGKQRVLIVNVGQIANDARDKRNNASRFMIQRVPTTVKKYNTNRVATNSLSIKLSQIPRLFLVATKRIDAGSEILSSYGALYWKPFSDKHST